MKGRRTQRRRRRRRRNSKKHSVIPASPPTTPPTFPPTSPPTSPPTFTPLQRLQPAVQYRTIHSIKEPYACDVCIQRFHLRYDLLRHREYAHERLQRPISPQLPRKSHVLAAALQQQESLMQQRLVAEARVVTSIRERESVLTALWEQTKKLPRNSDEQENPATTRIDLQEVSTFVTRLSELREATVKFLCAFDAWQLFRQCNATEEEEEHIQKKNDRFEEDRENDDRNNRNDQGGESGKSTKSTKSIDSTGGEGDTNSESVKYAPYVWRGKDYLAKIDHDTAKVVSSLTIRLQKWLSELLPIRDNPLLLCGGMPAPNIAVVPITFQQDEVERKQDEQDEYDLCKATSAITRSWAFPKDNDDMTSFTTKTKVVMLLGRLLARTELSIRETDKLLVEQQNTATALSSSTLSTPPTTTLLSKMPSLPDHIETVVGQLLECGLLVTGNRGGLRARRLRKAYLVLIRERRARWILKEGEAALRQRSAIHSLSFKVTLNTLSGAVHNLTKRKEQMEKEQIKLRQHCARTVQYWWKGLCGQRQRMRGARTIGAWMVSRMYHAKLSHAFVSIVFNCNAVRQADEQRRKRLIQQRRTLRNTIESQAATTIQSLRRGVLGRKAFAQQRRRVLRRESASIIQREWLRWACERRLRKQQRIRASVTLQSWFRGVFGLRRTALLRSARLSSLFDRGHEEAGGKWWLSIGKRTTRLAWCPSSPVELWILRRRSASRLQRWGKTVAVPSARKREVARGERLACIVQIAWKKSRRSWLCRQKKGASAMQRISRGWLGKRRVALLRCTRLSTLKGGIPRGYVVMRRLSDVKKVLDKR